MTKIDEIEEKIRKLIEQLTALRTENRKLRADQQAIQLTVETLTLENQKAKSLLAEYQQLRKRHEQAAAKVERALQHLQSLRS